MAKAKKNILKKKTQTQSIEESYSSSHPTSSSKTEEGTIYDAERMVVYSDAVFAIALTLMALEIKIPHLHDLGSGSLLQALLAKWPDYLSFVISFLIISVVWTNHHTIFKYVKKTDHTLIMLNSFLMLNISFIPFCSALLGEYSAQGGENATLASLIYGAWITLGGIPFNLVWRYGVGNPRLRDPNADLEEIRAISGHYIKGPIFYAIVTALAFVNVWLSLAGFVFLILFFLIPASWVFKFKEKKVESKG
ncbi:TMEM175 family protein [Leptospira kmetyi]|uniref:DUF1211 domain-containing protein n=1 Tax=Leptospira kmetyi TaxID=408139 RepID=A0AAD0UNI3_9LEPT|nr:TMEM175 family protein [Leptospira kmetyi]AYV55652.1 DUF1211 domain-containing protein [Leptospira kmetyi]EQA54818.1 PF06736 family protein [Leptospira kmetyi serovar Malaysia str. Bejo-Iso9]PJZ30136.1 DUF1211 domain-containing protein [Leptospira kmetyi]PJZ41462.1 DUF1211 domain-containing protein [Leptospira kmetyi]